MTLTIAILLLLVGSLVMLICDRRKSRLLKSALSTQATEGQLRELRFPFNEVLLGLLLVLAIVLCATRCLSSGSDHLLEFSIGYAAAILTSFGSFQRIRHNLYNLGLPKLEKPVLKFIIFFCIGMAFFLTGALAIVKMFL